jgi:hypothetical protein
MSEHILTWRYGLAKVLETAAMLAECTFTLDGRNFSPFSRAPWMGSVQDRSIAGHLRELGGDFVGVPFGGNPAPSDGPVPWLAAAQHPRSHPIHGPSADSDWTFVRADNDSVSLALDYPEDSPVHHLERTISVRPDAPTLDFTLVIHARCPADLAIGLHPIFRLPEKAGDLVLSAEFSFGLTHPRQTAPGQEQEFRDLSAVPQDRGIVDFSRLPVLQRNLNVQLCGTRGPITAYYVRENAGIVLDWDRALLPSLQIWHTDRGIHGPPWHGKFRGLGLEPIAAAFDFPNDVSIAPNPINRRGVATAIQIHPDSPLTIRHSVSAFAGAAP